MRAGGETLLVHGGGSGVGTAATTLAKLAGLRVIVTAGSREKCERCLAHGADVAINYNEEDFVERARGANVILDHIGARYLARDLECLAVGGRVVIIGSMGGPGTIDLNVGALLSKRQQIIGSTLRARSAEEKATIVASFVARFGDELRAGRVRPVIDRVFDLAEKRTPRRKKRTTSARSRCGCERRRRGTFIANEEDMSRTRLSATYRVRIPREVRESAHLKRGQEFQIIVKGENHSSRARAFSRGIARICARNLDRGLAR